MKIYSAPIHDHRPGPVSGFSPPGIWNPGPGNDRVGIPECRVNQNLYGVTKLMIDQQDGPDMPDLEGDATNDNDADASDDTTAARRKIDTDDGQCSSIS